MPNDLLNRLSQPIRGFKDDPKGFLLRGVDNGHRVPATKTKTAYSLTIHARVGNRQGVIGAVHEIAVAQTLQTEDEFEVNLFATGLPREVVPQTVSTRTLTLRRYDLYKSTIEQVFGTPELITLADQIGPVSLRLTWTPPTASDIGIIVQNVGERQVYEYRGCYITSLNQTVSMQNVIVGRDATLVWSSVERLQ